MDIVSYAALAITAYFVFDLVRAYRAAIGVASLPQRARQPACGPDSPLASRW